MAQNYYNLSAGEVERELKTNIESGLTTAEVERRLAEEGYNEFRKTKHTSLAVKFLSQFKSFMIIVLLVAAVVSGVIGYMHDEGFTDAVIILVIVVLNAIIGTAQEARAERSLDALERLSSPHSKVIRGGQIHVIPSRELVQGDVVVLETGDSVPADIRLTEAVNLKIEEAALTGESVPVDKNIETIEGEVPLGDRLDMAFGSTSVTYGRGKGIVVATGMTSEVGKIASMIQSVPETKTPMQERLDKLGRVLAVAALAICVVIFAVGVAYGRDLLAMFMTAVSLAVAAIPEGLPAVATIVLAVGVQRLVKKNAIVRRLPSVETLGSTQVICSDKTGTLTQNRMTVVKIYAGGRAVDAAGLSQQDLTEFTPLIDYSILANDARLSDEEGAVKAIGDPTETAMLDLGLRYGIDKNALEATEPRVAEIPFDSERKMMTTVHKQAGTLLVATKGGTDEVLAACDRILERGTPRPLTPEDRRAIEAQNLAMAGEALRVLAVAMNHLDKLPAEVTPATLEQGLVFVGLVGMIDPPREEVRVAVERCRTAGIKPVMITGDHKITATAIARQLGIMREGDEAVTGVELAAMSDADLVANIDKVAVYARVAPEHKVRIVKAFQTDGKIVAMTGDGVNDAPALKLADIGVAMGITGTDVSKEAADVVLADDNFATIVTAVEEGRRIYDNILKAIQFLLSTNIGEVLVLLVAVLANWNSPLLPIHILWINLVTDSLPALALSVDPAEPDIMRRKPINSRQGIMTRDFATRIILQGVLIGGLSLIANRIGNQTSTEVAQTMTFAVVAFSQITLVLGIRSPRYSAFRNMFSNKYLWGALGIVSAMMWVVLEVPALKTVFHISDLDWAQWGWVLGLSATPLLATELVKLLRRKKL
ncbi:MAG: calcium-translocating P-type ATPase, PMCA-type [Rikenellaceae bacterium]|jgi:Ca2+-transporting ATPase|nr:calcium-translocating P-type ATPase, PMCA-type [Rikenellaceae bacterium]